jgi:hypothetical protein
MHEATNGNHKVKFLPMILLLSALSAAAPNSVAYFSLG